MRVKDLMVRDVVSIGQHELTGKALEAMQNHGIQHLVVMDKKQNVVGMLSDRDLRGVTNVTASVGAAGLSELKVYNMPVGRIMSPDPIHVTPETSIRKMAGLILEKHFHSLPVEGKTGELLGIVTDQDILRAVSEGRLK